MLAYFIGAAYIFHKFKQARSQKCGLEGVRDGDGVWGGGCAPSPEKNFGIFSFEMVHFDAFWRTFSSTVIVTVMFMTSAGTNKNQYEKHCLSNEDHFNTETC